MSETTSSHDNSLFKILLYTLINSKFKLLISFILTIPYHDYHLNYTIFLGFKIYRILK